MNDDHIPFNQPSKPVVAFLILMLGLLMSSCFCLLVFIATQPYLVKGTL